MSTFVPVLLKFWFEKRWDHRIKFYVRHALNAYESVDDNIKISSGFYFYSILGYILKTDV